MENTKALSSAAIQRLSDISSSKEYKKATWHSASVNIRKFLSLEEYVSLTNKIVRECMSPDGTIACELLDFAMRANVIAAYAYVELPDTLSDIYDIAYLSGLYEIVCDVANKAQIASIISFVNNTIVRCGGLA